MFKRFTLLVVEYIREKFVWAKKKPIPVSIDAAHDKRIAENYAFDEVLDIYVKRTEYERRARLNADDYKPTKEEIRRFPRRPKNEQAKADSSMDLKLSVPPEQMKHPRPPRLKPPGWD
ncbi:hypothetical protein [Pectobacterium brasiliense]|uniref:hypothetical protein n=1 Tax=Pectobacterium brasiliense TaxID=180957 RepID=UPI003B97A437